MSLLVWLPFTGDLINRGLSDLKFSASTAEYSTIAKFNKSLNLKTASIAFTVPELENKRTFSIAFWIYCQSNSSYTRDWNQAIILGDGGDGLRFESTYSYSSRALSFHNNQTKKITAASRTLAQDKDKWYHVALVSDGTTLYSYTDGVNTYTDTVNDGALNGSVTINSKAYYGFMNDLRIYDHALSNKEVEELSKGLCCHYPLNDPYCTGSVNKYSGETFEGKPSNYGGALTITKLSEERGYNFKLNYTGTGTNTWASIQYPVCSFTAGKIYDYSCKVRVHSSNLNWSLRASRVTNDWVANMRDVSTFDKDVWTEIHLRTKLEATSERAGSTLTTAPLVEFYSESLKTKDKVYSFDIDIKDVQFAECESDAPATNGGFADTTIYDTSGFGNNGTGHKNFSISSGAPMYGNCYKLMENGSIRFPSLSWENYTSGTISMWINRHSSTSTWRNYLLIADSYNWTGKTSDFLILGSTGRQGIGMDCCSNVWTFAPDLNTWYLYTLTWDFASKTAKYYINGILKYTVTSDNIGTEYASKHGSAFIGNRDYSESDYSLSDFRLYSTALTEDQVMELFNTPVSVSNTGTLLTKGEVIES